MRVLSILCGLLINTTALAAGPDSEDKDDGKKIRIKTSTPLYIMDKATVGSGNSELVVKQTGLTLFTRQARVEFSYQLGKRFELGLIASFGGVTTSYEDDNWPETVQDESGLGLTAIYNYRISKKLRGFLQPIAGLDYVNDKIGSNTDNVTQTLMYGGDVGVRYIVTQGVHLDLAAEYMMGSGTLTDINENETDVSASTINLRGGMGVRF